MGIIDLTSNLEPNETTAALARCARDNLPDEEEEDLTASEFDTAFSEDFTNAEQLEETSPFAGTVKRHRRSPATRRTPQTSPRSEHEAETPMQFMRRPRIIARPVRFVDDDDFNTAFSEVFHGSEVTEDFPLDDSLITSDEDC